MSGHDADYIWNSLGYAIGLQFYQLWWEEKNDQRMFSGLSAFTKVPEIILLNNHDPGENQNDLIV